MKKDKKASLLDDDLKIEAKWARELYDKAIPNWMKKFGKKYGAKVEGIRIDNTATQLSLPVTNKMREAVMSGQPLFQEQDTAVRGAINMTKEGETIIYLFKEKNLSTFLHEIGHYFLKDLQMTAEVDGVDTDLWAMAKEYLGVSDGQEITVEQHEKFARSFENYLREGQSPNKKLRDIFQLFSEWLRNIYRKALDNNIEINNDIRYVFDRMLATEKEVTEARMETAMVAMLDEVHGQENMTDDERKEYAEVIGESIERAYSDINKIKLKDLQQRRKKNRAIATAEVEADPIYAGIFFLKYGRLPTDAKTDTKGLGISIDDMKETFGDDIFNALKKIPSLYRKDGGVDVLQAMETMGVKDPAMFLYALGSIESKAVMVENRTNKLMKAEDGQIETNEEVRNTLYEKQLFLESQFLAKETGSKAVSTSALRAWAKGYVARQSLKNAKDTHRMLISIGKQRRGALSAQRAGDLERAFDLNEKARRNEALLREHIKVKEAIPKMQRRWKKFTTSKSIHDDWRNQVRRLANKFGMVKTPLTINPDTKALNLFLSEKTQDKDPLERTTPLFSDWLTTTENASYKDMTWGEISEIDSAMSYLAGQGKEALGLKKLADGQMLEDAVNSGLRIMSKITRRKRQPKKFTLKRNITNKTRDYFASTDQMQFIMQRLDNYSHGANSDLIWNRLVAANNEKLNLSSEVRGKIKEHEKILRSNARKHGKTTFTHVATPDVLKEDGDGWTHDKIIAVALNMGNHENILRVVEGYNLVTEEEAKAAAFIDESMNEKEQREATLAAKVDLGLQRMIEITSTLTAEEMRATQGIIDVVNSLWGRIDAVHFKMNNFHQKKIEANELSLPAQVARKVRNATIPARPAMVLEGGYYPIKYDANLDSSGKMDTWNEQEELMQSMEAIHQTTKPKSGFLKERGLTGGGLPVRLNLRVIESHLSDTIHYITHAEALHDINRIVKNKRWAAEAKDVLGQDSYEMLKRGLNRVARPEDEFRGVLDRALNVHRVKATAYILAWNLSVALKQPFSAFAIANDIGTEASLIGIAKTMAHPIDTFKAVNDMSAFMRNRSVSMDRELGESMKKLHPNRRSIKDVDLDDLRNAGFVMIKTMDFLVVYPAWNAAYTKAQKDGKTQQESIMFADNTISFSQPTARTIDLSHFQGSTKGVHRLFTMFTTFTMKYSNRKRFFYNKWREGEMTTADYMWHNILESIAPPLLMASMISLLQDKELPSEEELLISLVKYQLIGLPYVSDIASIAISKITGGYQTNIGDSPMFEGVDLATRAISDAAKIMTDIGDKEKAGKFAWSMARLISYETGVPASKVVERIVKGAAQIESGDGDVINLMIPQYKK